MTDETTTISELKKKVQAFCEARDWDQYHNAKDLAIGIITESSELLELFRFKSDLQIKEMFSNPENKVKITEEVSDIFYFLLRFAQTNDIDLSTELKNKMIKNEIKYPIGKAKGSNKKYNEF